MGSFQIWNPSETKRRVLEAATLGEVQTVTAKNAEHRLALMKFAESLRKHVSKSEVGLDKSKSLNNGEFMHVFQPLTGLSEDDLQTVFDFLDFVGDGSVSINHAVAESATITPQLDYEMSQWLGD